MLWRITCSSCYCHYTGTLGPVYFSFLFLFLLTSIKIKLTNILLNKTNIFTMFSKRMLENKTVNWTLTILSCPNSKEGKLWLSNWNYKSNYQNTEQFYCVWFRKGISKFYSGKSKSFTSLADAAGAASMKEIVKPEDPYAKKRKNLLARNIMIGRSRSYADNVGGITKQTSNIGRGASCLTLCSSEEEGKSSTSICPLPPRHPQASANASLPQPPQRNSPWRSYSWSDLHSVAEAHDISGLAICSGNKDNKVHWNFDRI